MKNFITPTIMGLLLSGLIFELTKDCPNALVIYFTITMLTVDIWYLISTLNITINVNQKTTTVYAMDTSNVNDDSTDDSDHQNPGVDR